MWHSCRKHQRWALSCAAVGMLVLVCLGGAALLLSGGSCMADSGICTFPRRAGMSFGQDVSKRPFGGLEVDKEKCVKAMQIPQVRPKSMHCFTNP